MIPIKTYKPGTELRVERRPSEKGQTISVRLWVENQDGDLVPSRHGVNLTPTQALQVAAAIMREWAVGEEVR